MKCQWIFYQFKYYRALTYLYPKLCISQNYWFKLKKENFKYGASLHALKSKQVKLKIRIIYLRTNAIWIWPHKLKKLIDQTIINQVFLHVFHDKLEASLWLWESLEPNTVSDQFFQVWYTTYFVVCIVYPQKPTADLFVYLWCSTSKQKEEE